MRSTEEMIYHKDCIVNPAADCCSCNDQRTDTERYRDMAKIDLKGRDFLKLLDFTEEEILYLKLLDFTEEEILYLLDLAADLKDKKKKGIPHRYFEGRNIALIFEKTSTRTRCSFEVAGHDLGMGTTYLDPEGSQIGKKESIADTARVLAGMFDGIEYRGYGQEIVEELAKYAKVPVCTQMLADLLTIREHFGRIKGLRLSYFGDARYNTADSLMVAGAKTGMHIVLASDEHYFPDPALVETCREIAAGTGGSITLTTDPEEAARDAHILYTDVWVSMGEPMEAWAERIGLMKKYQVNAALMRLADPDAIFMHCLPAFHDQGTGIGRQVYEKFGMAELEVTDEVFESSQSLVFEEAENRMHTIKAVIAATLGL